MSSPSPVPFSRFQRLVEKLADLEHEQWIFWSKTLAGKESLSSPLVARWKEYWIPYSDLLDSIKEHDRKWARKVMEIIEKDIQEYGSL